MYRELHALASTLRRCGDVEEINLKVCTIDGYRMRELAPVIRGAIRLKNIDLGWGTIGTVGCHALATAVQDPHCNLVTLNLAHVRIDDDCAVILADALKSNGKLESLDLTNNNDITRRGWYAFSKTLCDRSSINGTYSSNHMLKHIGEDDEDRFPPSLEKLLKFNESADKKEVAIKKILHCHPNFDMKPFFEWDMKMLPTAVNWFDRAIFCTESNDTRSIDVHVRKLNAIYQFIHAMPDVFEPAPESAN